MPVIRALTGIVIVCLGIYALSIVTAGVQHDEIIQLSKHGNAILHKATEPERYWIAIFFWSIASVMLIGGEIYRIIKIPR